MSRLLTRKKSPTLIGVACPSKKSGAFVASRARSSCPSPYRSPARAPPLALRFARSYDRSKLVCARALRGSTEGGENESLGARKLVSREQPTTSFLATIVRTKTNLMTSGSVGLSASAIRAKRRQSFGEQRGQGHGTRGTLTLPCLL